MTLRVYRYEVPVDDQPHQMKIFSAAEVLSAAPIGNTAVEFWAEHHDETEYDKPRTFRVFGTGQAITDGYHWVATCPRTELGLVWHLYEKG